MTRNEFEEMALKLHEAGALVVEGPGGYKVVFQQAPRAVAPAKAAEDITPQEARRRLRAKMLG